MNTIFYDRSSLTDTLPMPETNMGQPSTTTIDYIDLTAEEKYALDDYLANSIYHANDISSILYKKQKSLLSLYDNNLQQQESSITDFPPLIGIIGRSERSRAFTKRLLLSGFPKPILCDLNSNELDSTGKSTYVSYEKFYQLSPTIVLITDNLTRSFDGLFPQHKFQLIIDARQTDVKYFSDESSSSLLSIPGSYRAFGNLSNAEIEHGSQRVGVAIEQFPPLNLVKLIYDLNCFPRGMYFLDQYSYNYEHIKSFRHCLFPLITTLIILGVCSIFLIIDNNKEIYNSMFIYRQASSICASTSIILLALLFLMRPAFELIEITYLIILKNQNIHENVIPKMNFFQSWLQSKHYLIWYSLSFGFLHLMFLMFSKTGFNSNLYVGGFFFGVLTLILVSVQSFVHFPWISERLLWNEYHCLTSHLGSLCLLMAFIHVFLHWQLESNLFSLKFLSMISILIVLVLRFVVYVIIHPILKLIQYIKNRRLKNSLIFL